jgi:hypothetical protein
LSTVVLLLLTVLLELLTLLLASYNDGMGDDNVIDSSWKRLDRNSSPATKSPVHSSSPISRSERGFTTELGADNRDLVSRDSIARAGSIQWEGLEGGGCDGIEGSGLVSRELVVEEAGGSCGCTF